MDGIAVRAADTSTAADLPVELTEIGDQDDVDSAGPGICACVDTGNPLPVWADAVVRIEDTTKTDAGFQISAAVAPGRDVRRIGEDIDAGTRLVPRGHTIRPFDVGAMLATGVSSINVRAVPSVATIATGSEIVEPGGKPSPGKVIEYNSRILAGYAAEWGAQSVYLGRVADDPETMASHLTEAAKQHDRVCVIAGSSAGRKDFTVDVLRSIGELHYHGVDMMPGKPAAFATVAGTPVLGIPGYPVSAVVAYRELLEPMIAASLGRGPRLADTVTAQIRRKVPSRLGVEEFLRVALVREGDALVAALLPRGAGSVSTLVRADGILRIGPTVEGLEPGASVEIELLRPRRELGHTVVVAGPPDGVTVDIEDICRKTGSALRITHLGLGRLDDIEALAAGEAHLAVVSPSDPEVLAHLESRLGQCIKIPITGDERILVATEVCNSGKYGRAIVAALSARSKH
jgi:putative molybdopterin biosynthesis protein